MTKEELLRRVGFRMPEPGNIKDTLFLRELEKFLDAAGGIEGAVTDVVDGHGPNPDAGFPAGKHYRFLFFPDSSVLVPDAMSREHTVMVAPEPAGSAEYLARMRIYWTSVVATAAEAFHAERSAILRHGDVGDVAELEQMAANLKAAKSALNTVEQQIENLPENQRRREMAALSEQARAETISREYERRLRVTAALEKINVVVDGVEPTPAEMNIENKFARLNQHAERLEAERQNQPQPLPRS